MEWSWEAKKRQITKDSKVGDTVNVGYIKDGYDHNNEEAKIQSIRWVKYVTVDKEAPQITVEFANGDVIQW